MKGRGFGFIGLLVTLLIAVLAGVIGYNIGLNAGLATATGSASGTAPIVYAPWGFGGFGFLGFILFILLIFLVVGAFRRAAWGGGHHSGYWGGRWADPRDPDHRGLPPIADSMLQDWHRRAHTGEPPNDTRTTGQTGMA
jgi:hypothetical protein